MADLRLAPDLTLPIAVVTEPVGIFANRGKGKSNAAHLLVEELHDAGLPSIVLDVKGDWYGIRSSRDGRGVGLPFLILGGEHADVPLDEGSGRAVARLLVELRVPTIVDLSAMSKTKARTWVMEFAEALYRANREPLMLVVDEADVLIPQRLDASMMRLLGAMEDIAKRGRQRGLGICVISQRVADVNKSVTDLLETLLLFAVTGVRTRKALLEWIDDHADPQQAKDVIATLSTLPPGECWVWSPGWLHMLQRVRLNRISTFDSHATPEPGKTTVAPRTFADVDLAAVKEAMADTIEKAKADDPKVLRARIAELERAAAKVPVPVVERVEVPVLTDEDRTFFVSAVETLTTSTQPILAALTDLAAHAERIAASAVQGPVPLPGRGARVSQPQGRGEPARAAVPSTAPSRQSGSDAGHLRAGARRMVETLGRMAPMRLTVSQWGMVAHLKTTGGTWSTYLSDIKRLGLVEENAAGWTLTDDGFDYIGGRPAPMTGDELQNHYRTILRAGAVKMLDALIDTYPAGLTRDELGERAGIVTTGGTFSTYLGELVRNQLAERSGDVVTATAILIDGANA